MAKLAYEMEQIWLRAYLDYSSEVCFELKAQRTMKAHRVNMSEVLHVLRTGIVIYADRGEVGASIIVIGRNCDEEEIQVRACIISEMMHVSIVHVTKTRIWSGK